MEIVLTVIILLLIGLVGWLLVYLKKLKQQPPLLSKKEIQFVEFTIDMYIKYAKELDIADEDQHEYIVKELSKIAEKLRLNLKE